MKKILTSGLILGLIASPAVADTTYSNENSSVLNNQCTTGFLGGDGVSAENSFEVVWQAMQVPVSAGQYLAKNATTGTQCPANSYCPGDIYAFSETDDQGINSCPTGYISEAGASAQNQCYRTCSVPCINPGIGAHVKAESVVLGTETASGINYYGSSCDGVAPVCSIQSFECDTGYHKYDPYEPTYEDLISYMREVWEDEEATTAYPTYEAIKNSYIEYDDLWGWKRLLASVVNFKKHGPSANENLKSKIPSADYTINANWEEDRYGVAAIAIDGNQDYSFDGEKPYSYYGLTENGTWGVSFSYGDIIGKSKCTATEGEVNEVGIQGNPDATTSGEARNCWCQATGIKGIDGNLQSIYSSWVFVTDWYEEGTAEVCAHDCVATCVNYACDNLEFRAALFSSAGNTEVCVANEITVTWNPKNGGANITNTCTYDGDIIIPTEIPEKTGYIFNGWRLVKPNAQ